MCHVKSTLAIQKGSRRGPSQTSGGASRRAAWANNSSVGRKAVLKLEEVLSNGAIGPARVRCLPMSDCRFTIDPASGRQPRSGAASRRLQPILTPSAMSALASIFHALRLGAHAEEIAMDDIARGPGLKRPCPTDFSDTARGLTRSHRRLPRIYTT